jgi:hypothetical protein
VFLFGEKAGVLFSKDDKKSKWIPENESSTGESDDDEEDNNKSTAEPPKKQKKSKAVLKKEAKGECK